MIPKYVHLAEADDGELVIDGTGDSIAEALRPLVQRLERGGPGMCALPKAHAVLVNTAAITGSTDMVGPSAEELHWQIMSDAGLYAIYSLGEAAGREAERSKDR